MTHEPPGHRINILGASGCGTSTLGRALALDLAVPYFDCDDFYHEPTDPPFQKQRDPIERASLMRAAMPPDASWVLAGGVAGLTPDPALDFTLIVFLHVPTEVRLKRLRCREQQRFGDRILPGGDMHKAHEEFVAWAAGYDAGEVEGKTLARHRAYLLKQRCPVLQIQGAPSTGEALLTVQRELKLRRPARG